MKAIEKAWRQLRRKEITQEEWWNFIETQNPKEVQKVVDWGLKVEKRLRDYKNSNLFRFKIRKYCNYHMYSDVHPYEVVKVISPKCVEIRSMKSELTKAPQEFYPGGFVGHFADNNAQEWKYESDPEGQTERVHLSKKGWGQGRFRMSDKPRRFYDYNF